ncbi:hypothetical protein FF2_045699 [Malus domestica]|uniref:MADS-box domain-containing protein n=1 Tax=Malus domestica TaxID=3750 RepID=A0A498J049_MALDO|nr:agamous-like MADS-box protein AGL29 [Malus domestica]RXH88900.1 hypothetical protein DVH24_000499 [Malus domestica]
MVKSPDNKITDIGTTNGKKESKGRRRVEIKRVEDKNKRHVTFSKRKRGLFNKAAELSVFTGAETVAIVVSSNGKVFCFGSPSPDTVIKRYLSDNTFLLPAGQPDNHLQNNNIHHSSNKKQIKDYVEASTRLKEAKVLKGGKKNYSNNNGGDGGDGGDGGCSYGWWERPIGMMTSLEELEEYRDALYKLKHNVEVRTNQMIRETSPSTHFSPLLFMDDIWNSPELSHGQGCMAPEFNFFI